MFFNLTKYNSFLFSLFVFYSVPNLLYILTGATALNPAYLFPLLIPPVFLGIARMHFSGFIAVIFLVVVLAISILISGPSEETLKYTLTLVTSFAFPACLLSAVSLNFDLVKRHFTWLAIVNLALLSYMVVARNDIYLDRDKMNYMSFGYWSLSSFLVFSFLYIGEGKRLSLPLLLISFGLMSFFGSRFASISAIFSFSLIYYYYRGLNTNLILATLFAVILILLAATYTQTIVLSLIGHLEQIGLTPTNLYRVNTILIRSQDSSFDGRVSLITKSFEIFFQNPIGVGVYGYYRVLLDGSIGLFKYPHNIFVQLLLEYGLIGFALISVFGGRIVFLIFSAVPRENGWIVIFLICGCTKLLVTGNYMWEPTFWMALILGLRNISDLKTSHATRIGCS